MSHRNKSLTERKKSKSKQKTAVSQRKNSESEDYNFYQEFQQFSQENSKVVFTKFEYMKEFFNLGITEFPTDDEITQIQHDILTTSGWNSNLKKNWTLNEKKVLIWLIGKLSQIRGEDMRDLSTEFYDEVSRMLCRRDRDQCKQKWAQMQKIALQQQPFRPEEDKKLFEIITQYQSADMGQKWSSIASELNQSSNVYRSSKQCRERWLNHLNPKISKEPWGDTEDIELLTLVKEQGRRWAEISKMMDGRRSENNLKNRFNSLIKREKDLPVISSQNGSATNLDDLLSGCTGPEISDVQKQAIDVLLAKLRWRSTQSQPKKVDRRESIMLVDNQVRRQSYQRNQTTVSYTVGNIEQEQSLGDLTPCLVNVSKSIIYFCTHDVFAQFFGFHQQYKDQFDKIKSELSIFDAGFQQFKSTLSMIEEIEESQKSRSIIHPNIVTNDLDDYFNLETPETFSRPVYVAPIDLIAKSALKESVRQQHEVEFSDTEIASEFDINLIMKKTLFIIILLFVPFFVFKWTDYFDDEIQTLSSQFVHQIYDEFVIRITKLDKLLDSFISSTHKVSSPKSFPKKAQNFANYYGGAVILSQSDALKQVDNILVDSVEAYMITECIYRDLFFVISLKEEIQLERIYFINKELYSSTIKNFQVFGSVIYPTNEWELLGKFEAEDTNDWQSFQFESHFLRYLKILIVDFHNAEYHCTLTQIRVQGQTVIGDLLDSYKRDKVFSPKIENDVQPQKLETTSVKISFNEILVDEERNDTCSFLDYFYHQPKIIDNQFINVLPYKSKQSLLKVTAQNILILSHNVELIKQHIIDLRDETLEQKNILKAEQEKQKTIETMQQQLLHQLQQQQLINQNLENQMKWVLNMFIIVFFAIAIMIIVMTMLCATRSPQLFLEKRPEDECQSALVHSSSGLLNDESLATPITKNGKQKKKKNK